MVNLMTQAEYARHRGVSPPAVHAAIKRGRITLVDGKIDSAQADIEWDKNTDHGRRENAFGNANRQRAEESAIIRQAESGEPTALDYMSWKARRERAEALRAELAHEQDAGNLYEKAASDRAAKTMARLLRDHLLAVPSRLAPELVAMTEVTAIERRLTAEMRVALNTVERCATQSSDSPHAA